MRTSQLVLQSVWAIWELLVALVVKLELELELLAVKLEPELTTVLALPLVLF
jgi:hypothetical protein